VQKMMRKSGGEGDDSDGQERRPMGLLQRLATGLSSRRVDVDDDDNDGDEDEVEVRPAARPDLERPLTRPPSPRSDSRSPDPVSEYAKRGGPQGLDPHGRPSPVNNPIDEDQLDIPAFLRRQANHT
jgi:cell division protein FtsZ